MDVITHITVWTNGNAIRKYTGQDKTDWNPEKHKGEWYKATAIIVPYKEKEEK